MNIKLKYLFSYLFKRNKPRTKIPILGVTDKELLIDLEEFRLAKSLLK